MHGGDIYTNGILKGRELIDFSSNINPLGIPKSFINHINEAVESTTKYPDIKYRQAIESLKEYTKISKDYFVLGNGAAEVIDLVISCFKKILIVVPSFVEYEIDAKKYDCNIEYSYLRKEDKSYDYEDILYKLKDNQAVIIGNPNNPNGGIIDKNKFKNILEFCEKRNKVVIVDEAFIEFTGDINESYINEVENYKCLFIIRALTKFFGMPGIRFGYGISKNIELLNKIKSKQNPWNINCFAEMAVKYVLKDKEYIQNSLKWIKEERRFLSKKIKEISFIDKVYETNGNYILVKLKGINCIELYDCCLQKGILIRKADNYVGLDETYVRFAIKDRKTNEKLVKVLKKVY
ncbi:pyridoxal phosphate-dependent aminotransferase [Haloimpatiens sp. FM7330]|uniref:pyridoxal phosphate-dependent aminotransferase n=1 Tax=Haloimpatiens sp. FM7330 TaxID=3298610 RepID=UPI00364567C0